MELACKQSPGVTIKAYIALLQDSYIRPGAQGTPYDSMNCLLLQELEKDR